MPFDYKKEYREFYLPKAKPELIDVPEMRYIAIRGAGDPNAEGGAYQAAIQVLYALAYTIKMSKKGDHQIAGTTWCRRWRAFGIRRTRKAWITAEKRISAGSPSFVCLTL